MKFTKSVKKAEKGFIKFVKKIDAFLVPDYTHGSRIEGVIGMPLKMGRKKRK
jgi:hypothetical protein